MRDAGPGEEGWRRLIAAEGPSTLVRLCPAPLLPEVDALDDENNVFLGIPERGVEPFLRPLPLAVDVQRHICIVAAAALPKVLLDQELLGDLRLRQLFLRRSSFRKLLSKTRTTRKGLAESEITKEFLVEQYLRQGGRCY